jgi:hypothetical protein
MTFLGQLCFADSRDLTGDLPGDVLLVFAWANERQDDNLPVDFFAKLEQLGGQLGIDTGPIQELMNRRIDSGSVQEAMNRSNEVLLDGLHFEWHPLGLRDLVRTEDMPEASWQFEPCHGHICRTTSWPQARRRRPGDTYLEVNGREVWSDYWLWQHQATQIGRAPYHIQDHAPLPGRPLCALSSVCPSQWSPYPWINRAEPLLPEGEFNFHDKQLMLVDTGCIYISIDNGELHWDLEYF